MCSTSQGPGRTPRSEGQEIMKNEYQPRGCERREIIIINIYNALISTLQGAQGAEKKKKEEKKTIKQNQGKLVS